MEELGCLGFRFGGCDRPEVNFIMQELSRIFVLARVAVARAGFFDVLCHLTPTTPAAICLGFQVVETDVGLKSEAASILG